MQKTYIYKITATLLAFVLVACSSDDEPVSGVSTPFIMLGGQSAPWKSESLSRANEDIPGVLPPTIGTWSWMDGNEEIFENQEMVYMSEVDASAQGYETLTGQDKNWWHYTPAKYWKPGGKYIFYATAPYQSDGLLTSGTTAGNFKLSWQNIPEFSDVDYLTGAHLVEYTAKSSDNSPRPLYMQHVMSRLRLRFVLGEEFSTLRIIRLKSVTFQVKNTYMLQVTFADEATEESGQQRYASQFYWQKQSTLSTPQTLSLPIEDSRGYVELSREHTEYQTAASAYVCPGANLNQFDITVTYDVYDLGDPTNHTPQLLRADEQAQSRVKLKSGSPRVEAGKYYDVNIKIEPEYLYVLSDNDPTVNGYLTIGD